MKHIKVYNKKFEDGEWWYVGQADGRRRVSSHVGKNERRMFVNGKYIPQAHPLYKPGRYKTFQDAAFSSLSKYTTSSEGQVYVITNKAWRGWVKIGMAIDAEDRCNQYQTSSPHRDYELKYCKSFLNRKTAEYKAHELCKTESKDNKGEWFKLKISSAIKIINNITEETV